MKKTIVLIAIFIFIGQEIAAQIEVSSFLKDIKQRTPIEFASVSIKNKKIGVYTDLAGWFKLSGISEFDTITIRHISYKTINIPVAALKQKDTVYLQQRTVAIEEIVIKPIQYHEKKIWSINIRSNSSFTGLSGFELGTFIVNSPKNSIIKEVIIKNIKRSKDIEVYYVKLHLYLINNGMPGTEIALSKNIFIPNTKAKNITLNIENENISLPSSGIFISLEWVGKKTYNGIDKNLTKNLQPYVMITSKKTTNKTLYRFWTMDWKEFSKQVQIENANIIIGLNLKIIR